MITLSERQKKLLLFFVDREVYTTISSLTEIFKVSERSIRYDLKYLNEELKKMSIQLETVPRLGTKLNVINNEQLEILNKILNDNKNEYASPEERTVIICIMLLLDNFITIDKIMDKLYISRNTALQDMKKVKILLEEYDICVESKAYNGFNISGDESKIRISFMDIVIKNKLMNEIHKVIDLNYELAEKITADIQKSLNKEYSEHSMAEIKILISFVLNRCEKGFHLPFEIENIDKINSKYFIEMKKSLKHYASNISFTNGDIDFIASWIKSAKVLNDYSKSNISHFNTVALKLIQDMEYLLKMNFSEDSDFVNSLSMHLNVAIYRLQNNFIIDNPLEEEIKYRMGFIYIFLEKSLQSYEKELGVKFPSAEIAFLSMHFGAVFEKVFNELFTPRVLILCNTGLSTSKLLQSKLVSVFPRLTVVSTCKLSQLDTTLETTDIDLVISTIPIVDCKHKHVLVNPLLDTKSINAISSIILEISTEKSYKYLAEISEDKKIALTDLVEEKHTSFELVAKDYKEALKIGAVSLIKDGLIKKEYIDDIIRTTETLGSYMVLMPEIAFAHAKAENVNESSVGIINLKELVVFGENTKVKTIILIANKEENKNLIKLVNILQKDDNAQMLKTAKSYEDIKNIKM